MIQWIQVGDNRNRR